MQISTLHSHHFLHQMMLPSKSSVIQVQAHHKYLPGHTIMSRDAAEQPKRQVPQSPASPCLPWRLHAKPFGSSCTKNLTAQ